MDIIPRVAVPNGLTTHLVILPIALLTDPPRLRPFRAYYELDRFVGLRHTRKDSGERARRTGGGLGGRIPLLGIRRLLTGPGVRKKLLIICAALPIGFLLFRQRPAGRQEQPVPPFAGSPTCHSQWSLGPHHRDTGHSAKLNLITKVLDFVQFGGPGRSSTFW